MDDLAAAPDPVYERLVLYFLSILRIYLSRACVAWDVPGGRGVAFGAARSSGRGRNVC
jgi:hypothetical protein